MPKRSPAEQLDQAIAALLASGQFEPRNETRASASVAKLVPLVRVLRAMPRAEFKARLRADLRRRISMNETAAAPATEPRFRRANFPNIAPYFLVKGAPEFIDFLVAAFEGTENIRVPRPDGSIMHAAVAIGNSIIEMGDANEQYPERAMTTHLYVPDARVTYARALEAGATAIYEPTDEHPSGDLWGAAMDPFGNTWYIATRKGWSGGPEGFLTVQPYLHLRGADKMIPFIEAALGAKASGVHTSPDGKVLHATVEIAGATLEIDEAHGDVQPEKSYLHVYVPDTDALYARAVAAGATGVQAPYTAPYGDRAASISDPFGNTWFLATYLGEDAR